MNSFSAKVLLQLSMQEEKGVTEDKMVGWHHPHNGHAFEQVPGDSEGQGSLEHCSPWDIKELDTTEQLNNSKFPYHLTHCHVAAIHSIHFPCQNVKCVF